MIVFGFSFARGIQPGSFFCSSSRLGYKYTYKQSWLSGYPALFGAPHLPWLPAEKRWGAVFMTVGDEAYNDATKILLNIHRLPWMEALVAGVSMGLL